MKLKKFIILPTTDHALKSLAMIYENENINISYANVSLHCINNKCSYKENTKFWKLYYNKYKIIRVLTYLFLGRLYIKSICRYLVKNKINALIVSNDCGFPQVYFIAAAKKIGLKTICHQVASGIIQDDKENTSILLKYRKILKVIFDMIINGLPKYDKYGDLSDYLILLGCGWAEDLKITKSYSVHSNPKFLHGLSLKQSYEYNEIIIFGVPLSEVPIVSSEIAIRAYIEMNNIAKIFRLRGIKVHYKPHPQEYLYKSHIKFDIFEGDIKEAFERFNISMSVSSTVCMEFRLSNRLSYELDFSFMPQFIRNQTQGLFTGSYTELLSYEDLNNINSTINKKESKYFSNSNIILKEILDAI